MRTSRILAAVGWLLPLLFAAFPLLSLFATNQSELELAVVWEPLALCAIAAVLLYGALLLAFRQPGKAAAVASLLVVAFSYYGIVADKISTATWFLAAWLAVIAVAVVAVARSGRRLRNLLLIGGAAAAVLAVGPIARVAIYQAEHPGLSPRDPRLWPTALAAPTPPVGAALPDIYVIVPDDYARPDVLRRYLQYDASPFLASLRRRGFVISDQARSAYSDSESNIAAELNLDYISRFPAVLGKASQDVRPVKRVIADNRAARMLKGLGYRYVHMDTDEVTFAGGNPGISPLATPDSFMNLWMDQSVLRQVGGPFGFDDGARDRRFRTSIESTFGQIAAVAGQPGRKFVFFHTLLPHDPYIYGAHGEAVTFPGTTDESLGSRIGMPYYVHQVQFLETKLLRLIDAIRARSRTPPVIVLQSDEGFQADPGTVGEETAADIRVKGLLAFLLPGGGPKQVPSPPTTINSLRFVFNRYLDTRYPMLRSASYPEGDLPYQFEAMPVRGVAK